MLPAHVARRRLCQRGAGMALLLLCAAAVGTIPARAASDGPSFDCRAARSKIEKAICADPALSALDRRIAAAYQKLLAALDAPGRTALRMDQRTFLEARDIQARRSDYDLKADLAGRAAFLESIETAPRAGFTGTWTNVYGDVSVSTAGSGFKVEISTVQPYPSYPTCTLSASGVASGNTLLVGGSEEERKDNDGWTVKLTREGATLSAELQRPREAEFGSPPFCGFRSTIDGSFFATRQPSGNPAR